MSLGRGARGQWPFKDFSVTKTRGCFDFGFRTRCLQVMYRKTNEDESTTNLPGDIFSFLPDPLYNVIITRTHREAKDIQKQSHS